MDIIKSYSNYLFYNLVNGGNVIKGLEQSPALWFEEGS